MSVAFNRYLVLKYDKPFRVAINHEVEEEQLYT